jgi:structural maintenance of chromosome 4
LDDAIALNNKFVKEIKQACEEVLKTVAIHEKQEVGLSEKKKHATGKAKKLRKSIQDVSICYP